MLQKRIEKLRPYFQSMEITNGTLIVKVLFENKWGTYPSQDERVKVAPSQEVPNEWFYYADYSVVPMEEVFDLIDETIEMNRSAAMKIELLSAKFEELKLLFSKEPLERLQTLTFTMKDVVKSKSASKRKTSRKPKASTPIAEPQEIEASISVKEDVNIETTVA